MTLAVRYTVTRRQTHLKAELVYIHNVVDHIILSYASRLRACWGLANLSRPLRGDPRSDGCSHGQNLPACSALFLESIVHQLAHSSGTLYASRVSSLAGLLTGRVTLHPAGHAPHANQYRKPEVLAPGKFAFDWSDPMPPLSRRSGVTTYGLTLHQRRSLRTTAPRGRTQNTPLAFANHPRGTSNVRSKGQPILLPDCDQAAAETANPSRNKRTQAAHTDSIVDALESAKELTLAAWLRRGRYTDV
ncbi:hypothetical protein VTO73DRAFT_5421 [Trametes versicolor]